MAGMTLITDAADGVLGDIKITDGDLSLSIERDAIVLQLSQKLKFFFAEWFLDQRLGVPYFERILNKSTEPELIDSTLKDVVLSTPLITRITQWVIEVDRDNREMRLQMAADSTYGEIKLSTILGA